MVGAVGNGGADKFSGGKERGEKGGRRVWKEKELQEGGRVGGVIEIVVKKDLETA